MTPFGHASISMIIGSRMKKEYLLALLIGSLISDVDFILLPFRIFNSVHRYYTHSLLFIVAAGIIILFITRISD